MIPGTTMRSRKPSLPSPRPSRNRGSVLAVVLVVLVVMMLGGVSLLRSVDTSALLSGNLAFKRDSVNRTSIGLNEAFKVMQDINFLAYEANNANCDLGVCDKVDEWVKRNYWPRLLETDANGVPKIIKDKSKFDAQFSTIKPIVKDGQEVRFLIERMCSDYGPSDEKKCSVSDRYELGGSYRQDKPGSISLPLYRITIRSDGVRNTQTYVQATVTTRVK